MLKETHSSSWYQYIVVTDIFLLNYLCTDLEVASLKAIYCFTRHCYNRKFKKQDETSEHSSHYFYVELETRQQLSFCTPDIPSSSKFRSSSPPKNLKLKIFSADTLFINFFELTIASLLTYYQSLGILAELRLPQSIGTLCGRFRILFWEIPNLVRNLQK